MNTESEHQTPTSLAVETQEIDRDAVMFRFNYVAEKEDWRGAAESAESASAFGRTWRVPLGAILAALGVGSMILAHVRTAGLDNRCEECFGVATFLLCWSILAAWGPIYQDLKYRLAIRRGDRVALDMTSRGVAVARDGRRFFVEWYQMTYAIDSADGLLMESRVSGPIWIPVRAFLNWEQQCEVHRFVEGYGVEQRSYGSGWGDSPLERFLRRLSDRFEEGGPGKF
jgi:hypothetical protein